MTTSTAATFSPTEFQFGDDNFLGQMVRINSIDFDFDYEPEPTEEEQQAITKDACKEWVIDLSLYPVGITEEDFLGALLEAIEEETGWAIYDIKFDYISA